MADLRGRYNADAKPSSGESEVIPEDVYTVKLVNSEWENKKDEGGNKTSETYLYFDLEVIDGEYKGSRVRDFFFLGYKNPEAVRVSDARFASLREAVGILNPKDSVDLHGPRFQVKIGCRKRKDDPEKMNNYIQRYIEKGQTVNAPQQQSENAPWAKNAPKAEPEPAEIPF